MKIQYSYWAKVMLSGLFLVMICLTPLPDYVAEAQGGGLLAYGYSAYSTITAETPLILYNFSGTEGDLIHVDVMSISAGLDPAVDLIAPDQQTLGSSQYNGLAAATSDAHLAVFLPQTGIYSLRVSGANGTTGNFLIELNGRSPVTRTPLLRGQTTVVNVPQNAAPQYFSFDSSLCPTTLTVLDPSAGDPFTFPFIVKVRDTQGQNVALLRGGDTLEDRVTVAQMSGLYEVEVWSDDPALAGEVSLLASCEDEGPACVGAGTTVTAGAPAAAGGEGGVECPPCPPCPEEEDRDVCADFTVAVELDEAGRFVISWTEVEGVDHTILAVMNQATGELAFGQRVEAGINTTTFDFALWDLEPGMYDIVVRTYAPGEDLSLCEEIITVEYAPPLPLLDCEIEIVAPLETIANGLQTVFWTSVPHDVDLNISYVLSVYGQFDARVAEGHVDAPATSMTLDMSEAAIGAGYGGENDFYLQIDAFFPDGERWCASGVRVMRNP